MKNISDSEIFFISREACWMAKGILSCSRVSTPKMILSVSECVWRNVFPAEDDFNVSYPVQA